MLTCLGSSIAEIPLLWKNVYEQVLYFIFPSHSFLLPSQIPEKQNTILYNRLLYLQARSDTSICNNLTQ